MVATTEKEVTTKRKTLDKVETLVLGGGASKGFAIVGVLDALYEEYEGFYQRLKTLVGVSIGALIAILLLIGYTPAEIFCLWKETDMKNLRNSYMFGFFDNGANCVRWLEKALEDRGLSPCITLLQLANFTHKTLHVAVINVNKGERQYFSHLNHPNCTVTEAFRMAINLPFLFSAYMYQNEYYIDAGTIDSFPIQDWVNNNEEEEGDAITTTKIFGVMVKAVSKDWNKEEVTMTDTWSYMLRISQMVFLSMEQMERFKPFLDRCMICIEFPKTYSYMYVNNETKEELYTMGWETFKSSIFSSDNNATVATTATTTTTPTKEYLLIEN